MLELSVALFEDGRWRVPSISRASSCIDLAAQHISYNSILVIASSCIDLAAQHISYNNILVIASSCIDLAAQQLQLAVPQRRRACGCLQCRTHLMIRIIMISERLAGYLQCRVCLIIAIIMSGTQSCLSCANTSCFKRSTSAERPFGCNPGVKSNMLITPHNL